ncbi:MAG: hypothetical protein HY290_03995 [Planctomycetia bacterium]|nr:hypothetical protein [Planctomycetia bacterium]
MIQPEEILRKAKNLYPVFLRAWLSGEPFFPRVIPADKDLDENLAAASESIRQLRLESKESRGFGYTVEWEERNSRTHGRNQFPRRIVFETREDLLRHIGKVHEFDRFAAAVDRLRSRHPILESWISAHRQVLIESAGQIDGLLQVVDYLVAHPRPGLFARELPLDVDTKFIEQNRRILREWLDLVLAPHDIRSDEEHFDRRFGLRYVEPLIQIRFLDARVQRDAGSLWGACAVPLHELAATEIRVTRALVVENKVNLLTLPSIPDSVALGGLGNAVTDLRYLGWLSRLDLYYWGDLDVEGFEMLSRLRAMFPRTISLFMDTETLATWRNRIATGGTGRNGDVPTNLTPDEQAAFCICASDNLRIEQERIPQRDIVDRLTTMFVGGVGSS